MTSLITNNSAMTALVTLKSISRVLDNVSNRVSTGQRIAAASDNAAYWSIATTVRTDNASLGAVKDALGLGSSAVDTAYNGLSSVITDIQNIRAKLQSAMTPGVDRAKIQTEISAIQSKMRAIADSSNSSGQNWLSVDSSDINYKEIQEITAGFSRGPTGNIDFSSIKINIEDIKLYDVNAKQSIISGIKARLTAASSLMDSTGFGSGRGTSNFAGNNESAIRIGFGAAYDTIHVNKLTLGSIAADLSAVTPLEFMSAVNATIAASPALHEKVIAGVDSAGRLYFEAVTASGVDPLTVESDSVLYGSNSIDVGFSTNSGSPLIVPDRKFTSIDLSSDDLGLSLNHREIGNDDDIYDFVQISASDFYALGSSATSSNVSSINGADLVRMINQKLVNNDSRLRSFLEDGKIKFIAGISGNNTVLSLVAMPYPQYYYYDIGYDTKPVAFGSEVSAISYGIPDQQIQHRGLLDTEIGAYSSEFGGASYSVDNLDVSYLFGPLGDADLKLMISAVDKVIGKVVDGGTKLGASKTQIDGQKAFVGTLIKVNDRTIGILVDADIEEESTKLKALQTQQQLAMQALSIANSSSQNLLSLFR
jgi:flagellin